jgi:hypothetical protein
MGGLLHGVTTRREQLGSPPSAAIHDVIDLGGRPDAMFKKAQELVTTRASS